MPRNSFFSIKQQIGIYCYVGCPVNWFHDIKKYFLYVSLLFGYSCSVSGNSILTTSTNIKYGISVLMIGGKIPATRDGKVVENILLVEKVVIKNNKTGKQVLYKPKGSDGLSIHQGWFADVWSPDGEYLLLPVGRFEGFAVFRAKDALQQIENNAPKKMIRVRQQSLPSALVHKFVKWEAQNTVVMSVGLSGRPATVKYSINDSALVTGKNYFRLESKR